MLNKKQITQEIWNKLPVDNRPGLDQALKSWWQDIRDDSGLRLNLSGLNAFEFLNIDQHVFDIPAWPRPWPNDLITLNQKLDCPYYIRLGKNQKLIIFGSTQAIMCAMYGDWDKFLQYLERT